MHCRGFKVECMADKSWAEALYVQGLGSMIGICRVRLLNYAALREHMPKVFGTHVITLETNYSPL